MTIKEKCYLEEKLTLNIDMFNQLSSKTHYQQAEFIYFLFIYYIHNIDEKINLVIICTVNARRNIWTYITCV